MTTWRVLKRDDKAEIEHAFVGPALALVGSVFVEVGTYESDSSYYLGYDPAQEIGERFGAGEYLFVNSDKRAETIRVGVRKEFYELEDEPPDGGPPTPEPDALIEEIEVNS